MRALQSFVAHSKITALISSRLTTILRSIVTISTLQKYRPRTMLPFGFYLLAGFGFCSQKFQEHSIEFLFRNLHVGDDSILAGAVGFGPTERSHVHTDYKSDALSRSATHPQWKGSSFHRSPSPPLHQPIRLD